MISFLVTPDDGEPYKVTATSRDIHQWERTTKGATFAGLMESMSMVHMYSIAYFASKRRGLFEGSAKDFEAQCDITPEGGDAPDPTPPDQSPET
jgi:hypothetical protein